MELTLTVEIDTAGHSKDESDRPDHGSGLEVIELLADSDSLAILSSVNTEFRTVRHLANECELPLSTAYRKVGKLDDAGLLSQRVQLDADGRHTSEYRVRHSSLEVTLTRTTERDPACGSDTQQTSAESQLEWRDRLEGLEMRTDGGSEETSGSPATVGDAHPSDSLFVEITGTDCVVTDQESSISSREIDETTTNLSNYLQVNVTDDGLSDTIGDINPNDH
jgi:hypothetical protein